MSQINVTTIRNRTGGAPNLDQGIVVGSAATFSGDVSVGGVLTYEDVTNVDSVGIVTAGKGFRATTGGIIVTAGISTLAGTIVSGITTIDASGVNVTGVVTATSTIIAGITTIDASGVNVTGVATVSTLKVGTAATINSSGLDVVGIASVGVAITMYASSGIVSATKFSGPGNIPGPSQSGTVTLAASDAGKFVSAGSGGVTLPASTLAVGEGITIYNNHSGDITLTCSAPTAVYLGTDGSTKTSITLATRCICTFFCVDASSNGTYVCIGGGIS